MYFYIYYLISSLQRHITLLNIIFTVKYDLCIIVAYYYRQITSYIISRTYRALHHVRRALSVRKKRNVTTNGGRQGSINTSLVRDFGDPFNRIQRRHRTQPWKNRGRGSGVGREMGRGAEGESTFHPT